MKKSWLMFGVVLGLHAQDAQLPTEKNLVDKMVTTIIRSTTFDVLGGQLLSNKVVKGQPYSAEAVTETTQVLADGNRIVNRTTAILYRDSEGRERREESLGKLAAVHLGAFGAQTDEGRAIFISDPVTKTSYALDTKSHTARKSPVSSLVIASGKGAPNIETHSFTYEGHAEGGRQVLFFENRTESGKLNAKPKVENLGTQVIEGVSAEGTRTTITIPAGQIGNERDINIVDERWISPELQVTVMSRHSDPRTGETVYKLTNINRAEPPHSLFEVPPDFTMSDSGLPRVRKMVTKEEDQQ